MNALSDLAQFLRGVARHPSPLPNRLRAVARFGYRQAHKRIRRRSMLVRWEGMLLEVPPDANSASAAYYFGRQDWWEFAFLARFLRHGDLVFDVGANVGVYSLYLAKLVGPAGEVIACEPDARNLERLQANLERNGIEQVRVVPAAVGAGEGEVAFVAGLDSVSHVAEPDDRDTSAEVALVAMTTMDHLGEGRSPVFAKVDVEGFEEQVLLGAAGLMACGWPIVWQLEFLPGRAASNERVAVLLERAGYRFCVYDIRTNTLRRRDWHSPRGNNLLAVRDVEYVTSRIRDDLAQSL